MKSFKKTMIMVVFLLVGILLVGIEKVNAASIEWKNIIVECIYSDGSLFEYSYNENADKWAVNKYTYSLKGADTTSNTSTSGTTVYAKGGSGANGNPVKTESTGQKRCKTKLTKSVYQSSSDGEASTTTYIKFGDSHSQFTEEDVKITWHNHFWWSNSWAYDLINERNEYYELVSENLIITDDLPEADETIYYKLESEKAEGEITQAISKPKYITVMRYGTIYLAKAENKVNCIMSI
jgi:hypothetical protein